MRTDSDASPATTTTARCALEGGQFYLSEAMMRTPHETDHDILAEE
jgi:hypothetical protein